MNKKNSNKINKQDPEEFYDVGFFDYLQTEKGFEVSKRILELVNDLKKSTLDKSSEIDSLKARLLHKERKILIIVFIISVLSATLLIYFDKFSTTAAVFFGTLIGYFFGKRSS